MEIWQEYDITRLASIICNLRKEGYNIETININHKNKFGGSCVYAKYKYHEPIEVHKCSICGKEYTGFGNNADPINKGRCCNACNNEVISERINQLKLFKNVK